MLLFTQYETTRGSPLSAKSLPRCITCQGDCVQQSHAGLPFSSGAPPLPPETNLLRFLLVLYINFQLLENKQKEQSELKDNVSD